MKIAFSEFAIDIHTTRLPPIHIEALAVVAAAYVALSWEGGPSLWLFWFGLTALGALLSVLAHEVGHVLVGQRCGLRPVGIRLHGFGGEAVFAGATWMRRHERWVALAGPLSNVAIGVVCLLLQAILRPDLSGDMVWLAPDVPLSCQAADVLRFLGWLNLAWAVLNLLPAYPLDGGQVFVSILTPRLGRRKAMYWTGVCGVVVIVCAGIVMVATGFGGWMLCLLALHANIDAIRYAR